jgi:hypothetical protein
MVKFKCIIHKYTICLTFKHHYTLCHEILDPMFLFLLMKWTVYTVGPHTNMAARILKLIYIWEVYRYSAEDFLQWKSGFPIDISQYRLLIRVLSAIFGPCSVWIAWERSSPMKGELRWRGPNSISKFDHHNISGSAVDDTWRHR